MLKGVALPTDTDENITPKQSDWH